MNQKTESKTIVAIFGPNLPDQSKGLFHVHAADCKDCGKYRGIDRMDTKVSNQKEAVRFVYPEDEYESDYESCYGEFHFAPCLSKLTTGGK